MVVKKLTPAVMKKSQRHSDKLLSSFSSGWSWWWQCWWWWSSSSWACWCWWWRREEKPSVPNNFIVWLLVMLHDNDFWNHIAFSYQPIHHLDNLLLDLRHEVAAYVSKTICEPIEGSRPVSSVLFEFWHKKFQTYLARVQLCSVCVQHLFPRWRQKWQRGRQRR